MSCPIDGSVVCNRKKHAECFYVHRVLALLSLQPALYSCGESPDFSLESDGKSTGLEVTSFRSSAKGVDGKPRRAIEEEWGHLQSKIMSEVEKVPQLKGIHGFLNFHALDVPNRRQHRQFVTELLALSLRMMATDSLKANPNKREHHLLSHYVKTLTLERVGCYITWEWDHIAAAIGVSEVELITAITPKASKAVSYLEKDEFDELWLLVVSEHRLSQTIPRISVEKLNSYETLNKELQKSGFAKVLLYQYMFDVVYEWPGWKKFGKEKFIPTIDEYSKR